MIALLLTALALADEPAAPCDPKLDELPETISVAWVSRGRETVGNQGWLEVVRTQDLNAWVAKEKPTVGRMLQALGLRKKTKEPKRRYKVTIFEVRSMDLCRPVEGAEGTHVAGLAACERAQSRATSTYSGCGYTTDTASGKRTFDTYRIQWQDAAVRGFCVLPAQRYVEEAR